MVMSMTSVVMFKSNIHLKVPIAKNPMNDYLENDLMLYYAFQFLFPLG